LIDNPATLDADRLNAMIVRARAFYDNGQTDKALAELDAAAARGPTRRMPSASAAKSFA
jgi:hypothetical protein